MLGLDFFAGIATGGVSIKPQIKGNVQKDIEEYISGFSVEKTDNDFLLPISLGAMRAFGKFRLKGELSGNVTAFRLSNIKELGQLKLGLGFQAFKRLTFFLIGGVHVSRCDQVNVLATQKKANPTHPDPKSLEVYFSAVTTRTPVIKGIPGAFNSYCGFFGFEGQYDVNESMSISGSVQKGFKAKVFNTDKHGLFIKDELPDPVYGGLLRGQNECMSENGTASLKADMGWRVSIGMVFKVGEL
ncbi:MAG: hypothetical protein H6850_02475 [Alphaproteobacteria bacterium]|nr:MAG: hypothetical protein H6850_02475 [Alphaproteobacteria bacterium]